MQTPIAGLITSDPALLEAAEIVVRVAPTEASVLILGETGTGKELLARALHDHSRRRGKFVAVDCGALPEQLVESLLFGHARGAFTGATGAGEGLFRTADEGTLFLDEVGNLPPPAQLSLLRVLQERRVRPVGSAHEVPVSARVVAATSEDLAGAVREGRFREDLLYRLDVIRVVVPPLRARSGDAVLLFEHFLPRLAARHGRPVPAVHPSLIRALREHDWPGNVRQLENLIERLVLTRNGDRPLQGEDLDSLLWPRSMTRTPSGRTLVIGNTPVAAPRPARTLDEAVDIAERAYLERLLEDHDGRMEEAALAGGVSRRTLQRKLRKHGLDRRDFTEQPASGDLWLSCPPFPPLRLGAGPRLIGREPACDLCLPHSLVSRQHLRITQEADGVLVEDLGSTNGTFLNGRPLLGPARLEPGDSLEVGTFELSLVQGPTQDAEVNDTHYGQARLERVLLGPGVVDGLLGELLRRGEPAVVQFTLPDGIAAGLLIDNGQVVRAYRDDEEGHEVIERLRAQEQGSCLVSRFGANEGPTDPGTGQE